MPAAATVILQDESDLASLAAAWAAPPTFVWAARRAGVTTEWLRDRLDQLPAEHKRDRFVLLTSGSTGQPKLMVGDRRRSERLTDALHVAQDLEAAAETVVLLPLTYTYAFVNQWLWSQRHRRRLVVTDGLRAPDRLREALVGARDAMICLVGAQLPLLAMHLGDERFDGVIRVNFAGGPFPQEGLGTARAMFPNARIFNNYGCAEAMPRLTLREAASDDGDAADVGAPLPGIELRCDGERRVLFRSPYRCVGAIDDAGFANWDDADWVPSGDLGELDDRGHLVLHGRANEVFKRYGEKISLPGLLGCVRSAWTGQAAFYREADRSGEPGHVLVLSPAPDKMGLRAVLKVLRGRYGRAHWPLRIESTAAIARLANGKLDMRTTARAADKVVHWDQRV